MASEGTIYPREVKIKFKKRDAGKSHMIITWSFICLKIQLEYIYFKNKIAKNLKINFIKL